MYNIKCTKFRLENERGRWPCAGRDERQNGSCPCVHPKGK